MNDLEPLLLFLKKEGIPLTDWPTLEYLDEIALPAHIQPLFRQSILTPALADYYQKIPKIRPPLPLEDDPAHQYYSRAIIMVIDNNQQRNDALLADSLGESTIIELGLITIHFAALPPAVIQGVREGRVPFGTLLAEQGIQTHHENKRYFRVTCNAYLSRYIPCDIGTVLYGRINTLVRSDNGLWMSKSVEILNIEEI